MFHNLSLISCIRNLQTAPSSTISDTRPTVTQGHHTVKQPNKRPGIRTISNKLPQSHVSKPSDPRIKLRNGEILM